MNTQLIQEIFVGNFLRELPLHAQNILRDIFFRPTTDWEFVYKTLLFHCPELNYKVRDIYEYVGDRLIFEPGSFFYLQGFAEDGTALITSISTGKRYFIVSEDWENEFAYWNIDTD